MNTEDSMAKVEHFIDWFKQANGTIHQDVAIAAEGNGEGFKLTFARKSDASGRPNEDVIVSCPHDLAFSILQLPLVAAWYPHTWIDSHDTTTVTRFMLIEALLEADQSSFSPYISMLPQPNADRPFNTPLYWSEDERAVIAGTNLYEATVHRERTWSSEFEEAKVALQNLVPSKEKHLDNYTFEHYKWAATVLSSRCFPHWMIQTEDSIHKQIISETDGTTEFAQSRIYEAWLSKDSAVSFPVLLPVLDLANHSPKAQVTWKAAGNAAQLLASTQGYCEGQEFFNNYGQKANDELILGYGFDLNPNDANSVLLSLDVAASPKVSYIRQLVEQSLSTTSTPPPALPQILNPSTPSAKSPTLYALRSRQDPLTSAASTPLSFMAMNTRELRGRSLAPFSIPTFAHDREPTRNGLATLLPFAWKLRDYRRRICSNPNAAALSEASRMSSNKLMAVRSRQSQLSIVEDGLDSLKTTLATWLSRPALTGIADLLTSVTPASILKKFRHLVRHSLGTRDADKLSAQGLQEAVLVLWVVNLVQNFEHAQHTHDDASTDDTDDAVMSYAQLKNWLTAMQQAYPYPQFPNIPPVNTVDAICWSSDDRKDAEVVAREYALRVASGNVEMLYGTEQIMPRVSWALRVVREEAIWIPSWLEPGATNDGADDGGDSNLVICLHDTEKSLE